MAGYEAHPEVMHLDQSRRRTGGIRPECTADRARSGWRTRVVTSLRYRANDHCQPQVPVPEQLDLPGMNLLLNLNRGTTSTETDFGESLLRHSGHQNPQASLLFRWCIQGDWKLLLTYDGEVNRYKSTHPRLERRPQLFNLKQDPSETKNLAKDHPELVSELAEAISAWYPVDQRKVLTKYE